MADVSSMANDLTQRVRNRLAGEPVPPLGAAAEAAHQDPAAALAAILAQAKAAAEAINLELSGGNLDDRNHYDYLAENLARLARFESFSLAEYTYHLADGRNPGVRLWLEEERWQRRVKVLLFPEVGQWRVDAQGRKITRLLLTLRLEDGGPRPEPPADLAEHYPPDEDWQAALTRALCLAAVLRA